MSSIFDTFLVQCDQLRRADEEPRFVSFSNEGWFRAMKEANDNIITHGYSATYGGIPRGIKAEQKEDIKVHSELPRRPSTVTFRVDHLDPNKTFMELAGQSLTADQLCGICRAWLDNDYAKHWGAFERGLDRLITQHGRFEDVGTVSTRK